jgi:hypothetical protein
MKIYYGKWIFLILFHKKQSPKTCSLIEFCDCPKNLDFSDNGLPPLKQRLACPVNLSEIPLRGSRFNTPKGNPFDRENQAS